MDDNVDERRELIFEVIENQMDDNDPPETKETYQRLKNEGYSDFVTKQLIGQCVMVELWDTLKNEKEFNVERYIENLKNLPEAPFDE